MSAGGVSASELYAADEVELLLEEIRSLEPTAVRAEEGDIAGSAARSPAGTEHSWDSHGVYARRAVPPVAPRLELHWRPRALLRPAAAVQLLLVLCCAVSGILLTIATRRPRGCWKLLLLALLSSTLVHGALVLARIGALPSQLPLRWSLLGALCAGATALALSPPAAVALYELLSLPPPPQPQPPPELFAVVGLSLSGAACGALLTALWSRARGGAAGRGVYRAVPAPPPPDHPL